MNEKYLPPLPKLSLLQRHKKIAYVVIAVFGFLVLLMVVLAATGSLKKQVEFDTGFNGLLMNGTGDGTYYDPGVAVGSCGWSNVASDHVAAMSYEIYGTFANPAMSPVCGACLNVTGPKGTVKVKMVDRCQGCSSGDLDLSTAAFDEIADQSTGRVKIVWEGCRAD